MDESELPLVGLRPVDSDDCRRIWEWRNEQDTRDASFNVDSIPFEQHHNWFINKLADPGVRIFIATDREGQEIGYVRFDISGEEVEISVSIDQNERGKGYGTAAIRNASNHLLRTQSVRRIVAHIKLDNPASKVTFERAGFALRGYKEIEGVKAYEMIYED